MLAVGGDHVSNDLAYGLKVPLGRAEQLKCEHGCALANRANAGPDLTIPNEFGLPQKTVSVENLRRIMGLRLEEVFQLIAQDLEQAGVLDYLRAGVFICGGGARIPQIAQLAEKVLQMPASLGQTNSISGLKSAQEHPEFAAAIGLVKVGSKQQRKRTGRKSLAGDIGNTIKQMLGRA